MQAHNQLHLTPSEGSTTKHSVNRGSVVDNRKVIGESVESQTHCSVGLEGI